MSTEETVQPAIPIPADVLRRARAEAKFLVGLNRRSKYTVERLDHLEVYLRTGMCNANTDPESCCEGTCPLCRPDPGQA